MYVFNLCIYNEYFYAYASNSLHLGISNVIKILSFNFLLNIEPLVTIIKVKNIITSILQMKGLRLGKFINLFNGTYAETWHSGFIETLF